MLFRINTDNFFLYNKTERNYYLTEAANYYLDRYVSRENENVYYVGIQELNVFFRSEEKKAATEEDFEKAEIYKQLGNIFERILEQLKQTKDGL
jgi:hypothetical protein